MSTQLCKLKQLHCTPSLSFSTIFQDIGCFITASTLNIVFARNAAIFIKQVNLIYLLVNFVQINDDVFYFYVIWLSFLVFLAAIRSILPHQKSRLLSHRHPDTARQRTVLSSPTALPDRPLPQPSSYRVSSLPASLLPPRNPQSSTRAKSRSHNNPHILSKSFPH